MWKKRLSYPREQGGAEWLVIQTGATSKSDWSVSIGGQEVATVKGGSEALGKAPVEFDAPEGGGKIRVSKATWLWWEPDVQLNGVLLPGSMNSPEGLLRIGQLAAMSWCVVALLVGLFDTFSDSRWGLYNALSWNLFLIIALIGWFLMRLRVAVGPYLVMTAMVLDALLGVLFLLSLEYRSGFDLVLIAISALVDSGFRIAIAIPCIRWLKALQQIRTVGMVPPKLGSPLQS